MVWFRTEEATNGEKDEKGFDRKKLWIKDRERTMVEDKKEIEKGPG